MNRPTWATVSLTTTDAPVSLLMRLALLDHTAARAETEAIDQERNIVLEALLGHEETTATVTDYNTLTAKLEVALIEACDEALDRAPTHETDDLTHRSTDDAN